MRSSPSAKVAERSPIPARPMCSSTKALSPKARIAGPNCRSMSGQFWASLRLLYPPVFTIRPFSVQPKNGCSTNISSAKRRALAMHPRLPTPTVSASVRPFVMSWSSALDPQVCRPRSTLPKAASASSWSNKTTSSRRPYCAIPKSRMQIGPKPPPRASAPQAASSSRALPPLAIGNMTSSP